MRAAATLAMPVPRRSAMRCRSTWILDVRGLGDGFDRGPADQPRALLGDRAAPHDGVGLVMLGCQPGPRTQLARPREAGDVTDLRHEQRREDPPDPVDGLDRPIARMAGELVGQGPLERDHLGVIDGDQVPQRPDRASNAGANSNVSSRWLPATPNRSVIGTCTPSLASTACTWALSPERSATSLAR